MNWISHLRCSIGTSWILPESARTRVCHVRWQQPSTPAEPECRPRECRSPRRGLSALRWAVSCILQNRKMLHLQQSRRLERHKLQWYVQNTHAGSLNALYVAKMLDIFGQRGGRLKMQEWKMREWKYRHETLRNGRGWKMQEWKCRHDSAGGGKCRSKNACGNLVQHS